MIPDFKVFLQYFSKETIQMLRLKDMLKVSQQIYFNAKNDSMKEEIMGFLQKSLSKQTELSPEFLLEIYFLQLTNPYGFFLDMRSSSMKFQDGQFCWNPKPLYYKFSDNFAAGLRKVYHGFFLDMPEVLQEGIDETQLLPPGSTEQQKSDLQQLLLDHFGNVKNEPMKFTLVRFSKSFHHVFMFFKKNNLSVPSDFVVLGCLLTSLYWGLERMGKTANVGEAFHKAFLKTKKLKA